MATKSNLPLFLRKKPQSVPRCGYSYLTEKHQSSSSLSRKKQEAEDSSLVVYKRRHFRDQHKRKNSVRRTFLSSPCSSKRNQLCNIRARRRFFTDRQPKRWQNVQKPVTCHVNQPISTYRQTRARAKLSDLGFWRTARSVEARARSFPPRALGAQQEPKPLTQLYLPTNGTHGARSLARSRAHGWLMVHRGAHAGPSSHRRRRLAVNRRGRTNARRERTDGGERGQVAQGPKDICSPKGTKQPARASPKFPAAPHYGTRGAILLFHRDCSVALAYLSFKGKEDVNVIDTSGSTVLMFPRLFGNYSSTYFLYAPFSN